MEEIVDLSLPIEDNPNDPSFHGMKKLKHKPGGDLVWKNLFFSKKLSRWERLKNRISFLRDSKKYNRHVFPDSLFLSNEFINMSVHCGTHLDAPYHYGPYCDGKRSLFINEVPLNWCYSSGVVLNLSHKKANEQITEYDLQKALDDINYKIKPFDIVLIRTDSDKLWPDKSYFTEHPGMSEEATKWLVDKGVKVIGIDTNGFDLPFITMVTNYIKSGNKSNLWPSHMYGRKKEYLQIERLANLDQLTKPCDFRIACFPISVKEAGASWIRAVAIME